MELISANAARVRAEKRDNGSWLLITQVNEATLNGVFSESRHPDIDEMASLAQAFTDLNLPWCIQARTTPDAELLQVAAEHGLTRRHQVPFMACAPESVIYRAEPAIAVRSITGAEARPYVIALAAGFESPIGLFGDAFTGPVLDSEGLTAYVVEADGQPVATGLGTLVGGQLGLFNISTRPAHRGLGYGRAITEKAMRDGFAAGASTAFLTSSSSALPLYESIGFSTVESWTYLTRP
jgi:ribosomal protein S18 acetylase RimI-like enzyme